MQSKHNQLDSFKNIIIELLTENGWTGPTDRDDNPYFVGCKDYETAIGIRIATAQFAPFFECTGRLSGEYFSQGANVLSTISFNIDPNMSLIQITAGARQFAYDVDQAVNNSYAMRIKRA